MPDDIIYVDIAIFLFAVFISSCSQVLLKKEADRAHASYMKEYLNVRVMIAYILFAVSFCMVIYTYKSIPLSMGPLLESIGYIYITTFGVVFFKEKINVKKKIALLMIIAGIFVYSVLGG